MARGERLNHLPADLVLTLIQARKELGWSQAELGRRVGLPQVHISKFETGKVVPRFDTLLDLVRVLNFDLLLVPKPLVPVVRSLVRDHGNTDAGSADDGEQPLYGTGEDDEEPHHDT